MLSWWQWAVMAAIPVAIVALYFLKLRRRPIEVPSTYLWKKSIEDLHVNSLWQRLRRSLLLLLQLLLILLAILALLRPSWRGTRLGDYHRYIFLIDNSASMSARDVAPSRLAQTKRRVRSLIDEMKSGDVAMVVSFTDRAKIEQMFTTHRNQLRRAVDGIDGTSGRTSLVEALKVAAGRANPGRSFTENLETQVSEAFPADLYIFSDGRSETVEDFTFGNLAPRFVPIGNSDAANVAIVAFNTRRADDAPGRLQAFARVRNFTGETVSPVLELYLDDELVDAKSVTIDGDATSAVIFDLEDVEVGVLELRANWKDDLPLDNRAWAVIRPPRPARVLLLSPGGEVLPLALATEETATLASLYVQTPEYINADEYRDEVGSGLYDLVIFESCQPKEMPPANTLFIGRLPPVPQWTAQALAEAPQIIDTDPSHPLMQLVEMGDVIVAEGRPLDEPQGGQVLVDTSAGPMLVVAPRGGFQDAVLGFDLLDAEGRLLTNWPLRPSFPVFMLNLLRTLGGGETATAEAVYRPGQTVALRTTSASLQLTVRTPTGQSIDVPTGRSTTRPFTRTHDLGVYEVLEGRKVVDRFAVNLFDEAESDITPQSEIRTETTTVKGTKGYEPARRDLWKWLVVLALVVLVFEWYIYNRRVYL